MYLRKCYDILIKVYRDGAYLSNAIGHIEEDRQLITAICYGVVERDYELAVIVRSIVDKYPKLSIELILKMGIYMLKHMSIPSYAVIDNSVRLVKDIGKSKLAGFVNAVLRRVDRGEYKIDLEGIDLLSFETSTPIWLTKKIVSEYGLAKAREILSFTPKYREHVRINCEPYRLSEVESMLDVQARSEEGGYFVKVNDNLKSLLKEGVVTYQSPSSMKIAKLATVGSPARILDVCSAPGGKSVYMANICPTSEIIACDVHAHRVALIDSYIKRMSVTNVSTMVLDATQFCQTWQESFDSVLCDVPCSGIGVRYTSPDILLNRTERDISSLSSLQYDILSNSSRYVKRGGVLTYSTCTILRQENERVVDKFLSEHEDFELVRLSDKGRGYLTILPMDSKIDGFFVAQMRKI